MIHAPVSPQISQAMLVRLAELAIILSGIGFMFNLRRIAGRVLLLGLFLAVVAGLVPRILS